MSDYNKTILTNDGLALVAKANKGTTKFTITRAATSAEKLADKSIAELQQLTELPSLMQYGVINDVTDAAQDSNIVIGTELVFNNKDLANSYNINAIGLFAKEDGVDKEILYALTTANIPESMPDFKNKVLFKFNMTMFVVIGQADNVTVNVVENGVVTHRQLAEAIAALPSMTDITNLFKKIENDARTLDALNSPNGNNIYNSKINLDTFAIVGITKFLGCQLQSSGRMTDFNQDTTNLYGWIFNVPKWNGAMEYDQIVYIYDYGLGTQIYERAKADSSGQKKENFEKIVTDADLSKLKETLQSAIENAGQVKRVNDYEPDDKGNVILPSISHPNRMYGQNEEVDIDKLTETGIYHFMDAKVIASIKKDALDGLPKTTDGTTMCGYLFVMRHDDYNREQVLLLNGGATDVVMATRSISGTNSWRACFRRLLNIDDFNTLWNKISTVDNKELVHQCDDLDSGVAYSKAHPNVFVATP